MKFWNIRTLLILTGHKSYMLNKAEDLVTYKSLLTSCYCENLHQALKKKKFVIDLAAYEHYKHQSQQPETKEN